MAKIDFIKARSLIDANLSVEFADVKSDPKTEDTAQSDIAIATIEAFFETNTEIWRDVPVAVLGGYMELRGTLYEDTVASADPAAQKLVRILSGQSRIEIFELADLAKRSVINGLFQSLVDAAVWTQADKAGAVALAKETVRRWRSEDIGAPIGRGAILLMKSGRA